MAQKLKAVEEALALVPLRVRQGLAVECETVMLPSIPSARYLPFTRTRLFIFAGDLPVIAVLHEFAHFALGHEPGDDREKQEAEADALALKWLKDGR